MLKVRLIAVLILLISLLGGFFIYHSEKNSYRPFVLGLDLEGGVHLVYTADVSGVSKGTNIDELMQSLKDVIERRVNSQDLSGAFGVLDPIVRTEKSSILGGSEHRLIVELPGVSDIDMAVRMIGQTPSLEFMLVRETSAPDEEITNMDELLIPTGLTGGLVEKASMNFDNFTSTPTVLLVFNNEGKELFSKITKENTGKKLAIILDGELISAPVIREVINDGNAVISGDFSVDEARELVRDLNFGALPLPIELSSSQNIGSTFGEEVLNASIFAGLLGFIFSVAFMVFWYRFSGFLVSMSLAIYVVLMLVLFKLIPVTLTSAGIAGFIISIGIAIDANILIFERIKEEIKEGGSFKEAALRGFSRAWPSIRDSNISSIITAVILFWFGTSLVKSFAWTLGLGVLVSMLTAITITRTFLLSVGELKNKSVIKNLFGFKS